MQILNSELLKWVINYAKYTGLLRLISGDNSFKMFKITDKVYVSNLPTIDNEEKLKEINTIISFQTSDEYGYDQTLWIDKTPKKYYRIPINDYNPPTKGDYDKLSKILEKEKGKILFHCYAGKGRSNCGACVALVRRENYNINDAITLVKRHNPKSNMNIWQLKSLTDYFK